jgi:chromosome segregation ATPase
LQDLNDRSAKTKDQLQAMAKQRDQQRAQSNELLEQVKRLASVAEQHRQLLTNRKDAVVAEQQQFDKLLEYVSRPLVASWQRVNSLNRLHRLEKSSAHIDGHIKQLTSDLVSLQDEELALGHDLDTLRAAIPKLEESKALAVSCMSLPQARAHQPACHTRT